MSGSAGPGGRGQVRYVTTSRARWVIVSAAGAVGTGGRLRAAPVSREDLGDQMPIVECDFLLQPFVDSG
jgi:hypothetical protein